MDEERAAIDELHQIGAAVLRDHAYERGREVYDFMKHYGIGESQYGAIMDAAAKGKHVVAHRLYGHHLMYDFPIGEPGQIPSFLEHELSDLFTRQGLPLLPGELLEDTGLLKYCDRLSHNWNFLNGFDLLAGTVAIYRGASSLLDAHNGKVSIDTFGELARSLGLGAFELAVAVSTANPLLLIGATLQLTATVRGLMNDGAVILFSRMNDGLSLDFSHARLSAEAELESQSIERGLDALSIDHSLDKLSNR